MSGVKAFVVLCGTLVSLSGAAFAQTHSVDHDDLGTPGKEAAQVGIEGYRVFHSHAGEDREVTIEVSRVSGNATVALSWESSGTTLIDVQEDSARIEISWNGEQGAFRLVDVETRDRVLRTRTPSGWSTAEGDDDLLDRHYSSIRLAALVLQDYLANSGHRGALASRVRDPEKLPIKVDEQPLLPDGEIPGPRCTGILVRGSSVGNTRSYCCLQATQNADLKCWNTWCIGCCRFLSCDALCAVGDYFCTCGITGVACGPPC